MAEEKQSISHTLWKSQIIVLKGCENFAHPAKANSHILRKFRIPTFALRKCLVKTYAKLERVCKPISQPCTNSKSLCENQQSLKNLFKALQARFSFRMPHLLLAKASITLRRLSFHRFSLNWTPYDHPFEETTHIESEATHTRASKSISHMACIKGGHTDSSLSRNPRLRAFLPWDSTS